MVDYGHGRRLSAAVDKPMADAIPESVGESDTVPAVGYRTAPPGQQNKSSTGGGGGGGGPGTGTGTGSSEVRSVMGSSGGRDSGTGRGGLGLYGKNSGGPVMSRDSTGTGTSSSSSSYTARGGDFGTSGEPPANVGYFTRPSELYSRKCDSFGGSASARAEDDNDNGHYGGDEDEGTLHAGDGGGGFESTEDLGQSSHALDTPPSSTSCRGFAAAARANFGQSPSSRGGLNFSKNGSFGNTNSFGNMNSFRGSNSFGRGGNNFTGILFGRGNSAARSNFGSPNIGTFGRGGFGMNVGGATNTVVPTNLGNTSFRGGFSRPFGRGTFGQFR